MSVLKGMGFAVGAQVTNHNLENATIWSITECVDDDADVNLKNVACSHAHVFCIHGIASHQNYT